MKLTDIIQTVPDLTEEKFRENVEELIKRSTIFRIPLCRDKEWTAEEMIHEWELVQEKKSNLSKSKRDQVLGLVSTALYNMVSKPAEENKEEET